MFQRGLCQSLLVFALVFAGLSPAGAVTFLGGQDVGIYSQAFAALKDGKGQEAVSIAGTASDRTLYDVVMGLSLAAPDSSAPFPVYQHYLTSHISWPKAMRRSISARAESRIDGSLDPRAIIAFFTANEAQTATGLKAYVNALNATGQKQQARDAIRTVWREGARDTTEQQNMLGLFTASLPVAEVEARVDALLWEGRFELAEKLFPFISSGAKKAALARIALAKMDDKAPRLLAAVPQNLQNTPGLLFERMRWRRKKEDTEGALAMFQRAGQDLGHAAAWWSERHALTRALMQKGEMRRAYDLVSRHGLEKGNSFIDAEFLSGWLALRRLNDMRAAEAHFNRLYAAAETPITLARGAYWLARTAEATSRQDMAGSWYKIAAAFGTTYYGQLAANRIYAAGQISAVAPAINDAIRARFEQSPYATLIAQLAQAGDKTTAENFALAWANSMAQEPELRLLCDLALRLHGQDLAVKISKVAAKKKIILPVEGYPVLELAQDEQNPSLVHAITRQESEFNPLAVSPSNAQGLMQLLPSTARYIAGKIGDDKDAIDLFNPATNVRLGSAYINYILDKFEGSLPLAVAAYNAGPGRVRQWIGAMGDPRGGQADMVDWVESIPFDETRNYVQRVMEALQIYRAKFAGGAAPLMLAQDLRG